MAGAALLASSERAGSVGSRKGKRGFAKDVGLELDCCGTHTATYVRG